MGGSSKSILGKCQDYKIFSSCNFLMDSKYMRYLNGKMPNRVLIELIFFREVKYSNHRGRNIGNYNNEKEIIDIRMISELNQGVYTALWIVDFPDFKILSLAELDRVFKLKAFQRC